MVTEYKKSESDLEKPVTLGLLLEFTDEFLLPRISETIKINNAELENKLKSYIDNRLADTIAEIFKRLDKKYQKEKQFKEKVLELFRKHNIGSKEDLAFLEGLVAGS